MDVRCVPLPMTLLLLFLLIFPAAVAGTTTSESLTTNTASTQSSETTLNPTGLTSNETNTSAPSHSSTASTSVEVTTLDSITTGSTTTVSITTVSITTGSSTTDSSTTGPSTTGSSTTDSSITGPSTTDSSTTGPSTTGSNTTGSSTTGSSTTDSSTTGSNTTDSSTTGPSTTGYNTTGSSTTGSSTTDSNTTGSNVTTTSSYPSTTDSSVTNITSYTSNESSSVTDNPASPSSTTSSGTDTTSLSSVTGSSETTTPAYSKGTNASSASAVAGGVVGGLLAAGILVGVVVFFMMRRGLGPFKSRIRRGRNSLFVTEHSEPTIQRKRPVKLCDFYQHVALLHKNSNRLFSMEFQDLNDLSEKHPRECAQREENLLKNRYTNILPFDHSRVKLVPLNEEDCSDYINANYLPGYNFLREYIATQGPLTDTVADLWRMVWDQKCRIIISLSSLMEGGKPKVDLYWPEKVHCPESYGAIDVVMTSESLDKKLVVRNFKISLGDETRQVKQFFLPGWEDYSANLTPHDVIEFINVVRLERRDGDTGPIVVHCSAGVGRTGTFIALDVAQQFIRDKDLEAKLDIFALVLRMRDCREHMVQTEKQYIFIHDCTIEMLYRKENPEEEQDHDYVNVERGQDNEAFVREDEVRLSMQSRKSQV